MWRDLAWVLDMLQATEKAMEYAKDLPELLKTLRAIVPPEEK